MDRILLIASATISFAFGAIYAAFTKVISQTIKALLAIHNDKIEALVPIREHVPASKSAKRPKKSPDRIHLPARIT